MQIEVSITVRDDKDFGRTVAASSNSVLVYELTPHTVTDAVSDTVFAVKRSVVTQLDTRAALQQAAAKDTVPPEDFDPPECE